MPSETRYISEWINRPAAVVYDYASDPANVASWAHGLGESVENVNGEWFVVTASGRLGVAFAERNPFGVLDHTLTLPTGEVISVPMRVVPDGDGSEVGLSLRRQAGVTDEDFARDAGIVQSDLTRLKHLVEASR